MTAACCAGVICASARSIERWLSAEQARSADPVDTPVVAMWSAARVLQLMCSEMVASPASESTSIESVQVRTVRGSTTAFDPAKAARVSRGC